MNRPFEDKRVLGPFAQRTSDIGIDFNVVYNISASKLSDIKGIMAELTDNLESKINSEFDRKFDRMPVTDVGHFIQDSTTVKIVVSTELREINDTMEHLMLDIIKSELDRLSNGNVKEKSYSYTV